MGFGELVKAIEPSSNLVAGYYFSATGCFVSWSE